MYSKFYCQQKLVTDICSQSFRKNVINPKLNYYRKKLKKLKKFHVFGQKNLKQNYNYNIPYFWWVHRGGMGLQILLYTLFDAIRWFGDITSQKRSIFDQISNKKHLIMY